MIKKFSVYLILTISIFFSFWPSIPLPPRADEVRFIYWLQFYNGLTDTLINAISWPRRIEHADLHIFRPLGDILLASEWVFFGYHFTMYNLLSIIMNCIVAIILYKILKEILEVDGATSIFLTIWATCFMLGSEAVIWSHMSEIILFEIFLLLALMYWWKSEVEYKNSINTLYSYLFFSFAALSIDQGAVLATFCAYCIFLAFIEKINDNNSYAKFYIINFLISFFLLLVLFSFNLIDLINTGGSASDLRGGVKNLNIFNFAENFFIVLKFWMIPFFIPLKFHLIPSGRMGISPLSIRSSFFSIFNVSIAIVILFLMSTIIILNKKNINKIINIVEKYKKIILIMFLIVSWLFLFLLGRVSTVGIGIIHGELYLGYVFGIYLSILVGIIYSIIYCLRKTIKIYYIIALSFLFASISIFQIYQTRDGSEKMAKFFVNDVIIEKEIVDSYDIYRKAHNPFEFSFSFEKPCWQNYNLPWAQNTGIGLNHNTSLAYLLFPKWYRETNGRVILRCPQLNDEVSLNYGVSPTALRSNNIIHESLPESHPPRRAFDNSIDLDSFFEATLPVKLDLYFKSKILFNGYSFYSGENGEERMPTRWIVYDIKNNKLEKIDDGNTKSWKPNEVRTFRLKEPIHTNHLLFYFKNGGNENNILRIYEIKIW